jgi:hypothetical protein
MIKSILYRTIALVVFVSITIRAKAQFNLLVHNENDTIIIPTDKVDSVSFDMTPEMQAQMKLYKTVKILTYEKDAVTANRDSVIVDSLQKEVSAMKEKLEQVQKKYEDLQQKASETGNILLGKWVWTLWDSLGSNTWQSYFKKMSGCEWDSSLNLKNDKPISYGGTASIPIADDGTQARCINLVSYKNTYPIDYIIIENINDRNYQSNIGSIEDKPFMRSNKLIFPIAEVTNYTDVKKYVDTNINTILSSISEKDRKRGTILAFPYKGTSAATGSQIIFSGNIINDGVITITWDNKKYSTSVAKGMTISDAIDCILQYSFGAGCTDMKDNDNSMSIFYYTVSDRRVTDVDCGNTGLSTEIKDTSNGGYIYKYFIGDFISDWENKSYWNSDISLYSTYKGIIEYLKKELPQAKIYWAMPFSVSVDFSSSEFKNADGSWSQDKFIESKTYKTQKLIYDIQKEVCEYYGVPYIDMVKSSGMDITNIETFFNSNNVHPKAIGYKRYAETIYEYLR